MYVVGALLGAFFLGVVQVVVYIGAIAVLILLAVMLTPNVTRMEGVFTQQWMIAAAVAVVFGVMLVTVVSPVMDEVLPVALLSRDKARTRRGGPRTRSLRSEDKHDQQIETE